MCSCYMLNLLMALVWIVFLPGFFFFVVNFDGRNSVMIKKKNLMAAAEIFKKLYAYIGLLIFC